MGIYRAALLVAVSHGSSLRNENQSNNNHTWTSLTSSSAANPEYYLNYYNSTGHRKGFKNDFGQFHGNVNIFLGGAMLIVISTIVCLICYCCHRKTKMRSSLYMQQRWFDSDYNMEVYSIEQYYDITTLNDGNDDSITMRSVNERPPSYECIMAFNEEFVKQQKALITSPRCSGIARSMSMDSTPSSKKLDFNGNVAHSVSQTEMNDRLNNNNEPNTASTSSDGNNIEELNNNNIVNENDGDGSSIDLDMIKANGIIKLDMSRIMDCTGLPTYEAALKLKST
ncbi:hypothetical protein ACKWTF_004392 [Chironomus riparius]